MVWRFGGRRSHYLHGPSRGDLRLPRAERGRQDHHHADVDGHLDPYRGLRSDHGLRDPKTGLPGQGTDGRGH